MPGFGKGIVSDAQLRAVRTAWPDRRHRLNSEGQRHLASLVGTTADRIRVWCAAIWLQASDTGKLVDGVLEQRNDAWHARYGVRGAALSVDAATDNDADEGSGDEASSDVARSGEVAAAAAAPAAAAPAVTETKAAGSAAGPEPADAAAAAAAAATSTAVADPRPTSVRGCWLRPGAAAQSEWATLFKVTSDWLLGTPSVPLLHLFLC